MRSKGSPVFLVFLSLVAIACGSKPSAVIIVDEGNITTIGELATGNIAGYIRRGEIEVIMKLSGDIVVFREDTTFHGLEGVKGKAYEINEGCTLDSAKGLSDNCKLDEVATVDLNQSDEEIARDFGVPRGSRIVRTSRKANERRTQPNTDWRQMPGFRGPV